MFLQNWIGYLFTLKLFAAACDDNTEARFCAYFGLNYFEFSQFVSGSVAKIAERIDRAAIHHFVQFL